MPTFDEKAFGKNLKIYRENTDNPNKRGCLSQYDFSEIIKAEIPFALQRRLPTIGRQLVSDVENGKRFLKAQDRALLVAIVQVLKKYDGIESVEQADILLTSGGYAALSKEEKSKIFGISNEALSSSQSNSIFTEFMYDPRYSRNDIFNRVLNYIKRAKTFIGVLNSHLDEPDLNTILEEARRGDLLTRIYAIDKLVIQHTYYNEMISRARDQRLKYSRLIQVPGGKITPENTGYHYLRHFYLMLEAGRHYPPQGKLGIEVRLFQGPPARHTTFVVIDGHTVLFQLTGIRPDGKHELRGLQVIQDKSPDGDPARWKRLFEYLREEDEEGMEIARVREKDLEQFTEATQPLGQMIKPELYSLIEDTTNAIARGKLLENDLAKLLESMIDNTDVEPFLCDVVKELESNVVSILYKIFKINDKLSRWWDMCIKSQTI